MYVLHHADKPRLYSNLPDKPSISLMVGFWKGWAKPLAVAGMAATALAGLFHYTRVGPNEVSKDEEREALDEAKRIKEDQHESS